MGIISYLICGGLCGWIASKIMGADAQMGILANIIVGIVGSFIGGFLGSLIFHVPFVAWSLSGFLIALLGACVLLWMLKKFRK